MAERRSVLQTTNLDDNEIVKASDMNFMAKSTIENVGKAMQMLVESEFDCIIGGTVVPYSGFTVRVHPLIGSCASTHGFFGDSEISEQISVPHSSGGDACKYTVEVQALDESFAEESRAFNDLQTGIVTYQKFDTKIQRITNIRVIAGDEGSAPDHSSGWVKLAEIHIPKNVMEITESMIKNITSDIPEEENEEWTNETFATFNPGTFSATRKLFRMIHDSDGFLEENTVGSFELDTGIDTTQVNGSNIPTGQNITVDGTEEGASNSIVTVMIALNNKLQALLDKYMNTKDEGNWECLGEIDISAQVDSEGLLKKKVTFSADGDGNAAIKMDGVEILTFTEDGLIEAPLLEEAANVTKVNSLVTRAVTNALNSDLVLLKERVDNLQLQIKMTNVNTVIDKFALADVQPTYISTENVENLVGYKTIDGIIAEENDVVMLKDQTDATENGIYIVHANAWERHPDYIANNSLTNKLYTTPYGKDNANKIFFLMNSVYILGEDELEYSQPTIQDLYAYSLYSGNILINTTISSVKKDMRLNFPSDLTKTVTLTLQSAASVGLEVKIYNSSTMEQKINIGKEYPLASGKDVTLKWFSGRWVADCYIPINDVYRQLGGRKSPREIFPCTDWDNISGEWANDFFRVVGGGYRKSKDAAIVSGKDYYTRSGTNPNYSWAKVDTPVLADLPTYYEKTENLTASTESNGDSVSFPRTQQAEELPNIKGTAIPAYANAHQWNFTGALYHIDQSAMNAGSEPKQGYGGSGFGLDASKSNPVYKDNGHVTPQNSGVQIWERIA